MRIDVLTLFPEMFPELLGSSILKRAAEAGHVQYHVTDIRDYMYDQVAATGELKHGKVDDRPFGGGPGMVMACQPLWDCVQAVRQQDARPATPVVLTPQGERLTQRTCEHLAQCERLMLIAGHYE